MPEYRPHGQAVVPSITERLRFRSADLFAEVQRADTKATALCGVAGGLLAVGVASLSTLPGAAWLRGLLACACGLLGLAVVAALSAIRPVLPKDASLTGLDGQAHGEVATAVRDVSALRDLRWELHRLSVFDALARRKFRAIKMAADLTVAAVLMAGIALLITYVTP